jgi:hypothetical protein
MKNKLIDLNDHLFETLERLNDEELTPEQLQLEVQRAKSITNVAQAIINNGNLMLDAQKHVAEYDGKQQEIPVIMRLEDAKVDPSRIKQ